ncbi:ATP-binding protein [Amycolatopsis cihanbeyliensis]|uniref:Non-specific serine/threonine protein kinase n=1 Tax=Amycolatopsis cihanbeyliensis TaxID=1128664 RepID=A0A542DSD6_AMYCI|nr:LuxR C-terminal-related transcriptional regulator [Amycolatopsis cihanbeyliensis]TQJ05934.1 non-specific serine/threonine protein kinase [Amycolatopsis cihanbeyliensis]
MGPSSPEAVFPAEFPAEPTTYLGRRRELARVRTLLGTGSPVTLTGIGGVGKTRLAGRVVAAVAGEYPDGVAVIELAELREPELLADTVAARLGLPDQPARHRFGAVVDHLRDRRFLLVLDNCEHLVASCARFVAELVAACPKLSVLATSRQALGIDGEEVLPVPPLAVPGAEDVRSLADLESYGAVQLFLERGRAVLPSLTVTDDNYRDLVELCRSLDGLPLAIELAAVRLRSLSVAQLRRRLATPLAVLTWGSRGAPARHQALRALIDWSYALCSEPERRVLARASVFAGGFGLAAAEQVCAGAGVRPEDVPDLLHDLAGKSLLVTEDTGGEPRYRMTETLREYGAERLAEAGERVRVTREHRDWCAGLTARYETGWRGPDQVGWIRRISREHANVRVALDYCARTSGEAVVGLRMVNRLDAYWAVCGLLDEARGWLTRLLAAVPPQAPERALSLRLRTWCAVLQGDVPAALADVRAGRELARQTGDEIAAACAEVSRGLAEFCSGTEPDIPPAGRFAGALAVFRRHGMRPGADFAACQHRHAAATTGTIEDTRVLLGASIAAAEESGELFWRSWDWWVLSLAEEFFGDPGAAERAGLEAFRLQQVLGNRSAEPHAVHTLGRAAACRGDLVRAATLFGISGTRWKAIGADPRQFGRFTEHAATVAGQVFAALGEQEHRRYYRHGRGMSRDEAVRFVLGEPAAPDNPLTQREREVAELVTKGMTSREIAAELVISPRTATTHVNNILGKLALTSRAHLAAWVTDRR